MVRRRGFKVCYLCGKELSGDLDADHIPPKQFYASLIRNKHKLNLLTLPVHRICNQSYKRDEEYFLHSIGPLAWESYSGWEIWKDILKTSRKQVMTPLYEKVYQEFDASPSGLILPHDKILKRFDGRRVWRVVWKITRGLFFVEKGKVLPEQTPKVFEIYSVGEKPRPAFGYLLNEPSRGKYPGVFDYKYTEIAKLNNFHFWGMLLWDKLIMQIGFHDPECLCERCPVNKNFMKFENC